MAATSAWAFVSITWEPTRLPLDPPPRACSLPRARPVRYTEAATSDPRGKGVPGWVERDFRAYLRCGILAHGFARIRCDACNAERLVAFSRKGRGVCPSCNTRRMVELAAHLTDHVLPPLPLRQWVLSLPKRIRSFLPHDPHLAGAVLRTLLRAIRTTLRRTSPEAGPDAQLGAVSFLHRWRGSLCGRPQQARPACPLRQKAG